MKLDGRRLFCTSVLAAAAACGGRSTSPTPVPVANPPQITCPVAPDPAESLDGAGQVITFPAPTVTAGQAPLTTSCLPVSGSTFPVGTTTVTCTTADARARTATCAFPVVVLSPPKLPVTSFLAFGDSITWGEDGTAPAATNAFRQHVFVQLPPTERYPDILQTELQARYRQQTPTVFNGGCPGEMLSAPGDFVPECAGERMDDTSAYRRFRSLADLHRWDAVLFMEGSNDANAAAGDSRVLGTATFYLHQMIADAKSRGMKVFVATIPPMVPPGFNGRAKGYLVVPTYDDIVRSLASSDNVPLVDVFKAFGSDASTLIGFDGLHPDPSGYQRIADSFFAAIKTMETRTPAAAAAPVTRVRTR